MIHILFWLLPPTPIQRAVTSAASLPGMGGAASAIVAPHAPSIGVAVGIAVSVTVILSLCGCCCFGSLIGWEHVKLSKLKRNLNDKLNRGHDSATLPMYNLPQAYPPPNMLYTLAAAANKVNSQNLIPDQKPPSNTGAGV